MLRYVVSEYPRAQVTLTVFTLESGSIMARDLKISRPRMLLSDSPCSR